MNRRAILTIVITSALFCACSQEPPPQSPAKPEAKPVVEATQPAPAALPPAEVAAPPVAPVAPAPKPAAQPAASPTPKPKPAAAADTAPALPTVTDTIILKASQGQVTLSHLAHAKRYPCATCHGEASPGKFELTKETAHALCRDCHKAKGAGPTSCGECHKK